MLNSGFLLPDIVTAQLAYGATILSFLGDSTKWIMHTRYPSLPIPYPFVKILSNYQLKSGLTIDGSLIRNERELYYINA